MSTDDRCNAACNFSRSLRNGPLRLRLCPVVDVFAENPLEGNALAIFTDARGLSTDEMQALARETNLSETTFILPRAPEIERERGVQVRIFLTTGEVPFAGHPTLGTASWLYWNHPMLRGAEADHARPRRRSHPCPLHATTAVRTGRLRHDEAERPNLRRDPQ